MNGKWASQEEDAFLLKCEYATQATRSGVELLNDFQLKAQRFGVSRNDLVVEGRVKDFLRAREKVDEYTNQPGITRLQAINWWLNDLAAGRVVIMKCGERDPVHLRFQAFVRQLLKVPGNKYDLWPDSWVGTPYENQRPLGFEVHNRPNGYSAIHQLILIYLPEYPQYPFEVQFMDALECIWEKTHNPVYHLPSRIFSSPIPEQLLELRQRCDKLRDFIVPLSAEIQKQGRR